MLHPADSGPALDRADRLSIALIVVAAAIPRLLLLASLPPLVHLDSDSYFEIAQSLWRGNGLGDLSRRTPLYPLLLWIAGGSRSAGLFPVIAIQHLLGIAATVLLYLIARRLFSIRQRWIATLAGLLGGIVIYPAFVEQSILSESLYTFLLFAAVYFLIAWFQENRTYCVLACGAGLGLAALTRPLAAGMFPIWAILVFLLRGVRKGARFLVFGGAALLMVLLPVLVRNHRVMGSATLTESLGRNLISVTDRLVDYDRGVQLPVKAIYREFLNDKRGPDAVVIYSAMPRLRRITRWSDIRIDRALSEIAWEAVRAHPVKYVAGRLRRLPLLFHDPASSQSYALHRETYVSVLEFVGRFNPDLVSRSVAGGVENFRLALAGRVYQAFALDLTSGWLLLVPLLGITVTIRLQRRGPAWLLLALLVYAWLGTILMQPPNARYRLPTLPLEILFTLAAFGFAARWLARLAGTTWHIKSDSSVLVLTAIVLAIVAGRALLVSQAKPVFTLADWKRNGTANQPPDLSALQLREMQLGGQNITVLYWNGASPSARETISAEVPVVGGMSYRLTSAYSCQVRDCAGGLIRVTALDGRGAETPVLGSSLAQERADNDLFWDQMERDFRVPATARALRIEMAFAGGQGNVVAPYFSIETAPTLFSLWRMGARGAVIFAALWLGLVAAVVVCFRAARLTG